MTELQRQTDEPLFPNILWGRPTSRTAGGRLLVLGGNKDQFSAPVGLANAALAAGAGEVKIVLPASLEKLIPVNNDISYVPSTPSGSMAKLALAQVVELAAQTDAVALAGNFSANSETTILIESLFEHISQPMVVTPEIVSLIKIRPELLGRKGDLLVLDMTSMIALANSKHLGIYVAGGQGVARDVSIVDNLAQQLEADLAVLGNGLLVAAQSQLSLTSLPDRIGRLLAPTAGVLATFWLQNRLSPFKGLTSGAFLISQSLAQAERNNSSAIVRSLAKVLDDIE